MKLSELEKKVLMLALDAGASDGEIAACASKFIHSLRKRYKSGVELIKDLESVTLPSRVPGGAPNPFANNPFANTGHWADRQQYRGPFGGASFTRPFGQTPPNPNQPKAQPPPRHDPFTEAWQDILRRAKEQAEAAQRRAYEEHAAAFAAHQAAAAANAHAQTKEHQEWAEEELKKKPTMSSIWKKLFGTDFE